MEFWSGSVQKRCWIDEGKQADRKTAMMPFFRRTAPGAKRRCHGVFVVSDVVCMALLWVTLPDSEESSIRFWNEVVSFTGFLSV